MFMAPSSHVMALCHVHCNEFTRSSWWIYQLAKLSVWPTNQWTASHFHALITAIRSY